MSDPAQPSKHLPQPPPPPPLPPSRTGAWQRIVGPLGFGSSSRPRGAHAHHASDQRQRRNPIHLTNFKPLPSQTAAHRTGIAIAALDINGPKTHAVLAGHEILKTIQITRHNEGEDANNKVTEDVNLRTAINFYNSAHNSGRRQFLPASDVKWSHGSFGHLIATAASNGPIVLYDVTKPTEIACLQEHRNQVHKLAFDPNIGYFLLSGGQDGTLKLWDLRIFKDGKAASSFRSSKQFGGKAAAIRDVRWSPTDAFEFITASDNGVIQKWDVRNAAGPTLRVNGHQKACITVDWHPDGRHVVSGGFDKYVRVWDFQGKNRQKPCFELRAPQAIRRIRWRPACWSAELAETGVWQSTQLITSYTQDDPRLHVWDLRRPYLPFRELDRYNKPATDLLWASKDLLWTVGEEGMFTQTDVSFASQVHKELPPCALSWTPDGSFGVFAEDRGVRRDSDLEDPSVGFLSVRQEKLSSGDDGAISRSFPDEDLGNDAFQSTTLSRRQSKGTIAQSAKSQTSTPPSTDGFPAVIPLEKAVFQRKDLFNNKQIGVFGGIPGVTAESAAVSYLAYQYTPAATEGERRTCPGQILHNLEVAFESNALVCDEVSMHRTAQSWRILSAVVVPELREWADGNRRERLRKCVNGRAVRVDSDANDRTKASADVGNADLGSTKPFARAEKARNNLLKTVLEMEDSEASYEAESTSNMTTPQAQPLPDTPPSSRSQHVRISQDLGLAVDSIVPLPPSVMTAHSTAAVASRALMGDSSSRSDTAASSPEGRRTPQTSLKSQGQTQTLDSTHTTENRLSATKAVPRRIEKTSSDRIVQKQKVPYTQRQEDRRAALRDYKAHARPLLTFDEPAGSPAGTTAHGQRHDSSDSFPMFSASTDSSHKARSMGQSPSSPNQLHHMPRTPEEWRLSDDSDDLEPSSPPSDESGRRAISSNRYTRNETVPNEGIDFTFGLDGQTESAEQHHTTGAGLEHIAHDDASDGLSISSSPDVPFLFEPAHAIAKPQVHSVNPLRVNPDLDSHTNPKDPPSPDPIEYDSEDIKSTAYIYSDFRPIDFSLYEPRLPFAWSSLPLIAHAVAFDLDTGPACGQFSANLMMHVYPYLFHHHSSSPTTYNNLGVVPETLSERLMQPHLSARVIENIFSTYSTHLLQLRHFLPLAELRKLCIEYGITPLYGSEPEKGAALSNQGPRFLYITCRNCHAPLTDGTNLCERCQTARDVCPVCLSLSPKHSLHEAPGSRDRSDSPADGAGGGHGAMWTFCHTCGHAAHFQCMVEWLSHSYSEGECPSQGCTCDCAPGHARSQRIQSQMLEKDDGRIVAGSRSGSGEGLSGIKKDGKRVEPSPAVNRARDVLRSRGMGSLDLDRETQSGDERGVFGSRRGSGPRSTGMVGIGSQRKSVRIFEPLEVGSRE